MILQTIVSAAGAYFFGAINFAIIFTQIAVRKDIRTLGNKNPGASNVIRSVGKGWGFLVLGLDAIKAIIPMTIARLLFFNNGSIWDHGALYIMGIAAVLGHIFPIYYRFKGGGGVVTMLAVSLWFVPFEFITAMLLGGFFSLAFLRKKGLWLTQWTPIIFITFTPFTALATTLTMDITIWKNISIGGHPWTVIAGCFVLSLMMLWLNFRLVSAKMTNKDWEKEYKN